MADVIHLSTNWWSKSGNQEGKVIPFNASISEDILNGNVPPSPEDVRALTTYKLRRAFGLDENSLVATKFYPSLPLETLTNAWDAIEPHRRRSVLAARGFVASVAVTTTGLLTGNFKVAAVGVAVAGACALTSYMSERKIKPVDDKLHALIAK